MTMTKEIEEQRARQRACEIIYQRCPVCEGSGCELCEDGWVALAPKTAARNTLEPKEFRRCPLCNGRHVGYPASERPALGKLEGEARLQALIATPQWNSAYLYQERRHHYEVAHRSGAVCLLQKTSRLETTDV